MKMKKFYRINFVTKKGGYINRVIDIEANNATEAKAVAKDMWYEHNTAHMFHIEVRRLKDTEEFLYNYFSRVKSA